MKSFSFRTFSLILAALCLTLAAGSCHRRTITKYGAPPADYKSMHDSKSLPQDGVNKV